MNAARKVIANELLPVYQTDTGEKIVDGRELHAFLNVGRDYTSWLKERIEKYGFIEKEDYDLTLTKTGERQNVLRHDYILKLDMAKELAMVENNEQGRKARKYFIEVEKRFRQNNVVPMQPKVPVYSPYPEIDRADRLLTMLHQHINLVSQNVNDAIQAQVVELITGKPVKALKQAAPDGWSVKEIADFLGVPFQRVAWAVRKNNLKTPEFGTWYDYDFKGQQKKIFIYNDAGKNRLVELLS